MSEGHGAGMPSDLSLKKLCVDGMENYTGREELARIGGSGMREVYGPLIKSGNRPIIRTARCCKGFPVFRSKSMACWLSTDSIASL